MSELITAALGWIIATIALVGAWLAWKGRPNA